MEDRTRHGVHPPGAPVAVGRGADHLDRSAADPPGSPSPRVLDLFCTCTVHGNHEDCRLVGKCWVGKGYSYCELPCECALWPGPDDEMDDDDPDDKCPVCGRPAGHPKKC